MNKERGTLLCFLGGPATVGILLLFVVALHRSQLSSKTKKLKSEVSCEGLPADQKTIHNGIYWCDASLWEMKIDPLTLNWRTNFLAILQENRVGTNSDWENAAEKKFYLLRQPPGISQRRYRAKWVGTNLIFTLISPASKGSLL